MNNILRLGAALLAAALCFPAQGRGDDAAKHAAKLHRKIISIDTHTDTAVEMYRGKNPDSLHVNLEKMRKGGMDAVFFATYVGRSRETKKRSSKRRSMPRK